MERDTEEFESSSDEFMPEMDEFDSTQVPLESESLGDSECEALEASPEVEQVVPLDERTIQRRNLDARRRIEQLREAQWLKNELDDWE